MERDGRSVKPALIHGDLWEGNIGTSFDTGDILIFDAGAYYAHNEMDIGMWRCARHRINSKVFFNEYLRNVGPSDPIDEWDDRNRLYCVKMNMVHSGHHKGDLVRQTAFDDMCFLVDKYAPWPSDHGVNVLAKI
ncbi:MAG: hypothetical protein M4579_007497 [Chaenotheca gracillima]|nr:MAG: hypothetical protein M4579_007497 [Chaenotheca gracillima]